MVALIDKSSKTRSSHYYLVYRLNTELGKRFMDRALSGDPRALDRLERLAWEPRKRPALVKLVADLRARVAQ